MNTSSLCFARRVVPGCLALLVIGLGSSAPLHAQQVRRFPEIKVQSPLLAVPNPPDGNKQEGQTKETAAQVEAPKLVAEVEKKEAGKPQMIEPKAASAAPPAGSAAAKPGAEGLIPQNNKQVPIVAEDPNLAPLPELPVLQVTIDPNEAIISKLRGITLFKDDRKGPTDVPSSIPGNLATGVSISPDLSTPDREELVEILQKKYIGRSLSFRGMDEVVKDILAFYSEKKRPMTHVYIPEQEITDKVKIAVLEGRLGDVRYSGDGEKRRWYQAPLPRVPRALEAQQGGLLDMDSISASIYELNVSPWARLGRQDAHPYRRASVALSPGAELGLTDVELAVQSRAIVPIQAFTGWDNTGTVVLGENRFNAGLVWYDAFNTGFDHQLGIQFQTAENFDLFHAVIASYQVPLRRLNSTLQFYGAFVQSAVSIPTAGVAQSVEGDAIILGGRYYYHLPSLSLGGVASSADEKAKQPTLYHEIGFGFDYKAQTNDLFFGGVNVFPTLVEVAQYVAEYNVRQTDKWGETTASLAFFYSPGSITRNNTDAAFLAARTGGTADYSYFRGNFTRLVDLGALTSHLNDFKLIVRGTGQWSTANLLASEQLGLGGQDSVRGYPERVLRGDRGLFLQADLYSPAFHPLEWLAKRTPDRWTDAEQRIDELRFLLFYDYGWADVFNPTFAEPGETLNLSSVGVGLRYRFNKSMTFRFDYGFRLEQLDQRRVNVFDLSPRYSNDGDGYAHFGLSLSF